MTGPKDLIASTEGCIGAIDADLRPAALAAPQARDRCWQPTPRLTPLSAPVDLFFVTPAKKRGSMRPLDSRFPRE